MKVVSLIRPRNANVRRVTVNGTLYRFEQQDDEFVAEVTNPTDLNVFGRSPHFRCTGKSALEDPRKDPAPDAPADEVSETTKDADGGATPPETPDPITAEASELLTGSVAEIGRNVGNVSALGVVRRAIELEGDGQNRASAIKLLEHALQAAEQAGVED